jgi:hypothetical protein
MDQSIVVLRYRDGRTERVPVADINVDEKSVAITRDGAAANVSFSELKAIFFPRTNPDDEPDTATGSTISVEFADGEVIRGIAHYNPERNGFFLFPHDRSKNDRIFVVNSAIVSIEVEKL